MRRTLFLPRILATLFLMACMVPVLVGCPDEGSGDGDGDGDGDTGSPIADGGDNDAGSPIADGGDNGDGGTGVVDAGPIATILVDITGPSDKSTAFFEDTISLAGSVSVTEGDLADVTVLFTVEQDPSMAMEVVTEFSSVTGVATGSTMLSEGTHKIILTATRGEETVTSEIHVTVCGYAMTADFDEPLDTDEWRIYGGAQQINESGGGWLEMTNNQMNTRGKIFNIAQTVTPGSLSASFKIYTGPNDANGADGFSLYIVDALSVEDLENVLDCSGGIGNAFTVSAPCVMSLEDLAARNTFAIEFDTFANGYLCGTPQNGPVDPTCLDHLSICLDGSSMPFYWLPEGWGDYEACTGPSMDECKAGLECLDNICTPINPWNDTQELGYGVPDESSPVFWAELGNIEDSQWHDVDVILEGNTARVLFDDVEIINAAVPAFDFKGGYLGFTGGCGAACNYHRFDDLKVRSVCAYNGP
jgi:hypothetical protein